MSGRLTGTVRRQQLDIIIPAAPREANTYALQESHVGSGQWQQWKKKEVEERAILCPGFYACPSATE
jgi:hypothetical protein